MPETLLGDLSQVKLFDILKPLLTEKKTGRVNIRGKEDGEICFEIGDIVHARTNHFAGENAFFTIMGWKAGRITFDPGVHPKEKTIPITTEQLLLNWSSRKQEFEKIKEVIPSTHSIFRLSLQKDGKEKNISADQWNMLVLSNGMKTISEIAKSLEWDEYKVLKTVYQLVQVGLLERAEDRVSAKKKSVKEDFFAVLDMELKKVMGPVAPFIIDDKLVEFGEDKASFPQERALPFMEALSEEISNPSKRNEFLKVTIKLISF
jgi:DNA-binding MarR family transcriptional regulator